MTVIAPRTKDNRRRMILLAAVLLFPFTLFPFGQSAPVVSADVVPQRSNLVVQYVHDSADFPLTDFHAENIDQLNYAFVLLQNGQADVSHMRGLDQVSRYLDRHPHITGVLSVGGWGAEGFPEACATPAGRQLLANSLLTVMDAHGFTGLDIDWEYPGVDAGSVTSTADDVENWYALLALLRSGLDERQAATGRKHILAVALGAGEEHIAAIDGTRLNDLVDQAVIMAYDLRGFDRMTGHHAGLYPDGETMLSGAWAVQAWLNSGISADRLLLGVPQYGRMWRNVTPDRNGLHVRAETSGNRIIPYADIPSMVEHDGYARHYDDYACAPYLFNGTNFISYDDPQSAVAKAAYAQEHNLLGVALWEARHDPDGALLSAVSNAFIPGSVDTADTGD